MINLNKTLIAVIVAAAVVAIGGLAYIQLAGQKPAGPAQTRPETAAPKENPVIEIKNFTHSPSSLTVKAGILVTVKNLDTASHTVTSDTPGVFDTGLIGQNQTATFVAPESPGTYGYHCTPHPNMQATLIVEE